MKLKMTFPILLLAAFILFVKPVNAFAKEDGTLVIRNLDEGDVVELYRIANYEEEVDAYSWAPAVSGWIYNSKEGMVYQGLIPASLATLPEDKALEFCSQVLMGLRNDEEGTASLVGFSFTATIWKEEYEEKLRPGFYVLLPKGYERVYNLKWFQMIPEENVEIEYGEEDYSKPLITSKTTNESTDTRGGLRKENLLKSDLSVFDEDWDIPITGEGDHVTVSSVMTVPNYSRMFSDGKRLLNMTVTVPCGFDLEDNTTNVYYKEDEEYKVLPAESYTSLKIDNMTLYLNSANKLLFFGSDLGYFYEPGGEPLQGTNLSEVLETYNASHGTEYMVREEVSELEVTMEELDGSDSLVDLNTFEELDNIEALEAEEDSTESGLSEIGETEDPDAKKYICEKPNTTVIVVILDTTFNCEELKIEFEMIRNNQCGIEGRYPVYNVLTYSVSPLDDNLRASLNEVTDLWSYGLRITACEGERDSYEESAEAILKSALRMTEDVFSIYRFKKRVDGNTVDSQEPYSDTYKIYNEEIDKTDCFVLVKTISVNREGEIFLGGIEPDKYLIVQEEKTAGHTLSQLTFLIEKEVWYTNKDMEGNGTFEILWLDYPEYYLPGTGSNGRIVMQQAGIMLILLAGVLLMLNKKYKVIT